MLIGLAILLIVGGALVSAWLAAQAGHRAYFVAVDREVAQGAEITDSDLTRVSLPEEYKDGISSSDKDSVVGKTAATRLLPGTVLIPGMLSDRTGLKANQTQLTVPVDDSPFVRGLQPGAQMVLAVGSQDRGGRQAIGADLVSVGSNKSGSGIAGGGDDTVNLVVAVDVSCLSPVSQAIEDKTVTPALIGSSDNTIVQTTCRD
jgi:hypothetical protein